MIAVIFAKVSQRLPNKHLLPICNKPMIMHVYDNARGAEIFDDVLILSKNPDLKVDANVILDPTQGTLIDAIYFAVHAFRQIFALGGDMPLVDGDLMRLLVNSYNGSLTYGLNADDFPEPLLAIYGETILEKMDSFRRREKSVSKFLTLYGKPVLLGDQSRKARSVNTYSEYESVLRQFNCLNSI